MNYAGYMKSLEMLYLQTCLKIFSIYIYIYTPCLETCLQMKLRVILYFCSVSALMDLQIFHFAV